MTKFQTQTLLQFFYNLEKNNRGGGSFVILHPEFSRDYTPQIPQYFSNKLHWSANASVWWDSSQYEYIILSQTMHIFSYFWNRHLLVMYIFLAQFLQISWLVQLRKVKQLAKVTNHDWSWLIDTKSIIDLSHLALKIFLSGFYLVV